MGKNSFILYIDYKEHVDLLTDEQAGVLLKGIFYYITGNGEPKLDDVTKMAFSFIKQNLKRDHHKYESIVERNVNNGKKGGRPKNPEKESETQITQSVNKKPKKADIGIGIDIDNDIVSDIDIDIKDKVPSSDRFPIKQVIDYLNEKVGKAYKGTAYKTRSLIKVRANEGYVVDDFKQVIDKKAAEWLGTELEKYLRPETLFGNKFDRYLQQDEVFVPTKTEYTPTKQVDKEEVLKWVSEEDIM